MKVNFKKFDTELDSAIPEYKTDGSAGIDLSSSSKATIFVAPGKTALVPTNLVIELPSGYEGQVRPRSGLALKHSITVLNTPGTIDSDYRGEVKVVLINHSEENFEVNFGDRIAQLVIAQYTKIELNEVSELSDSVRGDGGYGSTGK